MNESVNIVLGNRFRDSLGSLNVDVLKREVPEYLPSARQNQDEALEGILGGIIASNEVENDV